MLSDKRIRADRPTPMTTLAVHSNGSLIPLVLAAFNCDETTKPSENSVGYRKSS